jgi:CDP-6-deoxy-D-xylo-4-hexulose-3-dehydrase
MTKQELLKNIKDFLLSNAKKEFVPGEDWVRYSGPHFDEKEILAAIESILEGWYILGEKGRDFELEFSKFLGKKYGIFTNSGSSANLLMFQSLTSRRPFMDKFRLEPGSKFITPVTCFPTTINPIMQSGFEPVFCRVDLPSLNPDIDHIEEILRSSSEEDRPKGIVFAHVLGNPPDMDRLMSLVEEFDLVFLEDACDALGSTYDGKPLGSFGLISTCSFFPAHHMTTMEGGFVATNESRIDLVLRSFRDWGRACYCNQRKPGDVTCGTACGKRFNSWLPGMPDHEYDHRYVFDEIGFNLKPLEHQAAIGLEQIKKLPEMEQARRDNFARLKKIFGKYDDYFMLPEATEKSDPCWFGFLAIRKDDAPFTKQEVVDHFEKNKVQTRSYFTGNVLYHNGYRHLAEKYGTYEKIRQDFPNAHKATKDAFFLGTFIGIEEGQLDYIEKVLDKFMEDK